MHTRILQETDRQRDAAREPRGRLDALVGDFSGGVWTPTPLERRIAVHLELASAGDGVLTAPRVRDALWEGSFALLRENDGRFAVLLMSLVPLLEQGSAPEHPRLPARAADAASPGRPELPPTVLDDVRAFLAAVSRGHAPA